MIPVDPYPPEWYDGEESTAPDRVKNIVYKGIDGMMNNTNNNSTVYYGPRVDGDPRKRANITLRASIHELMASMAAQWGCSRSHLNPYAPAPGAQDYEAYDYRYLYDEVGNFTKNHEYSGGQLHYKDGRRDLFNGDGKEAVDADPEAGSWRYDANGNATRTPRHQELAYTHDNQARYVDMGGGTEVRYFRHGDQRVLKFVRKNGVKALGGYLGPWEYHERTGVNARAKVVLHVEGHGRHAQGEVVLDGADSESLPWFFVHGDHLGSGHILTKADGTLLSQEEYFPYGRASDRRDTRNRYRFIGVEQDEVTGLCMTGPRTYDPVTGRFLQGDPIASERGGINPFHYASGNPVGRSDPGGYSDASAFATAVQPEAQRPFDLASGPSPSDLLGITERSDALNQEIGATLNAEETTWMMPDGSYQTSVEPPGLATGGEQLEKAIWGALPGFSASAVAPGPEDTVAGAVLGSKAARGVFGYVGEHVVDMSRSSFSFTKTTGREMLGEAVGGLKGMRGSGATASEMADAFEQMAGQINKTDPSWSAARSAGPSGAHIFLGEAGEGLVIDASGNLFRGKLGEAITFGEAGFAIDFSQLRPL